MYKIGDKVRIKEPKSKLTQFEKKVLEYVVNHGYEWIARDDNRDWLCIYKFGL